MSLAPNPMFPERSPTTFERTMGVNNVRRGPLRFQEGLLTDRDISFEFGRGNYDGIGTAPGRPNHNQKVDTKPADQTMAERVHAGSSSWIEAPPLLSSFVQGAFTPRDFPVFEMVVRNGRHQNRPNAVQVDD